MSSSLPSPNPVWFITGCSGGLGRALARAALERGDFVYGTFRRDADAAAFADEAPTHARGLLMDVTDRASIEAALGCAIAERGQIDYLVNNAGAAVLAPLEEITDEQLARMFEVNVLGPMRVIRAALPHLRQRRSGHIMNISAIAATVPEPGFTAYGAAKAALSASAEALALEVAPFGLKVTTVVPGPFRTSFIDRSVELTPLSEAYAASVGKFAGILQRIKGRQSGDPAKAAAALLSIAGRSDAPTWLPLGKYAYDQSKRRLDSRRAEIEQHQGTGLPTDFTTP